MTAPRGIRNNNPGNIRHGQPWLGLTPEQPDRDFATFSTMAFGVRALLKLLLTYRAAHGLSTVRGIIGRWAPPVENDTGAYVAAVARALEVDPDDELPVTEAVYLRLAQAIAAHENGAADAARIPYEAWRDGAAMAFGRQPQETPAAAPAEPQAAPEPVAAPQPLPDPVSEPQEPDMALPILPALLPVLLSKVAELIPEVAPLIFNRGDKSVSERNVAIGKAVLDKIVETTATPNAQAAVERIATDPGALKEARAAVVADLDRLTGIAARLALADDDSRDRASQRADGAAVRREQLWRQYRLTTGLSVFTGILLCVSFVPMFNVKESVQVQLVALFLVLVTKVAEKWGTMIDYGWGGSAGSQLKDVATIERESARR